jgi:hypothetical protein
MGEYTYTDLIPTQQPDLSNQIYQSDTNSTALPTVSHVGHTNTSNICVCLTNDSINLMNIDYVSDNQNDISFTNIDLTDINVDFTNIRHIDDTLADINPIFHTTDTSIPTIDPTDAPLVNLYCSVNTEFSATITDLPTFMTIKHIDIHHTDEYDVDFDTILQCTADSCNTEYKDMFLIDPTAYTNLDCRFDNIINDHSNSNVDDHADITADSIHLSNTDSSENTHRYNCTCASISDKHNIDHTHNSIDISNIDITDINVQLIDTNYMINQTGTCLENNTIGIDSAAKSIDIAPTFNDIDCNTNLDYRFDGITNDHYANFSVDNHADITVDSAHLLNTDSSEDMHPYNCMCATTSDKHRIDHTRNFINIGNIGTTDINVQLIDTNHMINKTDTCLENNTIDIDSAAKSIDIALTLNDIDCNTNLNY